MVNAEPVIDCNYNIKNKIKVTQLNQGDSIKM